jgi:hypothetical protein
MPQRTFSEKTLRLTVTWSDAETRSPARGASWIRKPSHTTCRRPRDEDGVAVDPARVDHDTSVGGLEGDRSGGGAGELDDDGRGVGAGLDEDGVARGNLVGGFLDGPPRLGGGAGAGRVGAGGGDVVRARRGDRLDADQGGRRGCEHQEESGQHEGRA